MGCGSSQPYTQKQVQTYINECQLRLPSAQLTDDGAIKLTTTNGFFNSSSLLDATWLQGKITNQEYRQAIDYINQRVSQVVIGTSSHLPINQIPKAPVIFLAVEELNTKYNERLQFVYQVNDQQNCSESFLLMKFK